MQEPVSDPVGLVETKLKYVNALLRTEEISRALFVTATLCQEFSAVKTSGILSEKTKKKAAGAGSPSPAASTSSTDVRAIPLELQVEAFATLGYVGEEK